MVIRRYWVQDGIFEHPQTYASGRKDVGAALERDFTALSAAVKDPIGRYEQIWDEILKRNGYPTKIEELRACDRAAMPPEVEEATRIKLYKISPLRKILEGNSARTAAALMDDLVISTLTIETRPLVPMLEDRARVMKGRYKGGKAPKKAAGIALLVGPLVAENPSRTAQEHWADLEERTSSREPQCIEGYEIYRDSDLLHEENDTTVAPKSITFRTFQRYVTDAKKSLRISRRK